MLLTHLRSDGSSNPTRNKWTALVEVEVSNAEGITVDQAVVSGAWSTGRTSQCTTSAYGRCGIRLSDLLNKVHSVIFTVNDVQRSRGIYDPAANADPDGDSNGAQITVARRGSVSTFEWLNNRNGFIFVPDFITANGIVGQIEFILLDPRDDGIPHV